MEFLLLGPVAAHIDGRPVDLGRRRERLLLGVLLLDPGRVITIDRLVDLLWEDRPTPAARASLHAHVSRLRSVLNVGATRIATRGAGYVADVDPEAVDAHRFRRLVQRAARLTDPQQRAAQLRDALDLWRGPLLADVADDRLRDRLGADLAELRIDATEARAEADLERGHHREVVLDLTRTVAAEPTRERLTELLMLAYVQSGRPAEALAAYGRASDALERELGIAPGPRLIALHDRILRNDPELTVPPADPVGHRRRFLPRDVPDFTGRTSEMQQLDILAWAHDTSPAIVVTAVAGTAGVGKTALAVHWAHRSADRFPDGQLYLDLRGYDPGQPAAPVDALAALLRALDVPPERVPVDVNEAAALFRSLLADRRMLILLDNARSATQVRPLLPASPTCLTVITSRDALNGLVARDGARRLDLDVMTTDESVALIARITGQRRPAEDQPALAELAALCGHLPIALRIAAAMLADRPAAPVTDLLAELRERGRLTALDIADDPASSVRTLFGHSLATQPSATRRVFSMLGVTAGGQFGVEAVAAICDIDVEAAAEHLGRLTEAHLIQEPTPTRHAIHDLLRDYARSLLSDTGPTTERLSAWYLGACDAAAALLYPQMVRLPVQDTTGHERAPTFDSHATARAWLDLEWPNVVAWVNAIASHSARHAWLLADAMRGYFWLSRLNVEWLEVASLAFELAESADDHAAVAAARLSLGNVHLNLNDLDRAVGHYLASASAAEAADWPTGQASALNNLATLHWIRGELDQADSRLREALALNRRLGRQLGEARNLSQLSQLAAERGRLADATSLAEQALAIETAAGSLSGQVKDTIALGTLRHLRGDSHGGELLLHRALTDARVLGETRGECETLLALATIAADLGRYADADSHVTAALAIARDIADPHIEAPALNLLALIRRRTHRLDEAEQHHLEALRLADAAADANMRATALVGLAQVRLSLGQPDEALAAATEASQIALKVGYRLIEADALTVTARVEAALGRSAEGVGAGQAGLAIYRESGCPIGVARALLALADITADDVRAAHLLDASENLVHLGIADGSSIR